MHASDDATFRDLLSHDHQRLDAMLSSILELAHLNVEPDLRLEWAAYEDAARAHLDAEERFLLPGLTKHDLGCSMRIHADHQAIRSALSEIGVGLDLHIIREEQMFALARMLRAHAKMEEGPLYDWADAALPTSYVATMLARLRRPRTPNEHAKVDALPAALASARADAE